MSSNFSLGYSKSPVSLLVRQAANQRDFRTKRRTVSNWREESFLRWSNCFILQQLKNNGFRDGIMEKAYRRKPLTYWQKKKNKLISSVRFVVERAFGTMKRQLLCGRARYRERWRVEGEFYFKAMSYNLLKAARVVHSV